MAKEHNIQEVLLHCELGAELVKTARTAECEISNQLKNGIKELVKEYGEPDADDEGKLVINADESENFGYCLALPDYGAPEDCAITKVILYTNGECLTIDGVGVEDTSTRLSYYDYNETVKMWIDVLDGITNHIARNFGHK